MILEESLKSLEQEFSADFIRVHRNALVNRRYIRQLERHNDGTSLLWLQGVEIPLEVSRRQGSELKRFLKEK